MVEDFIDTDILEFHEKHLEDIAEKDEQIQILKNKIAECENKQKGLKVDSAEKIVSTETEWP